MPTYKITIHLRPETRKDLDFLSRLYASTREKEMSLVAWDAERKDHFTNMQFRAQREHYYRYYPTASFLVIEVDGLPAGRLYVDRWEKEIRLMDLCLLPEFRRQGIGGSLLSEILAEGQRTGKTVTVHVEVNNPARSLYQRLGFEVIEDKGMYLLMSWNPQVQCLAEGN